MFLIQSQNSCSEKCPNGFYGDNSDNICKSCDKTCLTCKGKLENECLSCNLANGVKLLKGYCSNSCPGSMVRKKNSDECNDINICFDSLILKVPKIFSIQLTNYIANVTYKLNVRCNGLAADIVVVWSPIQDAVFSADNMTVEIPVNKLKDGIIDLSVDINYNGNLIKNLTGKSFLLTYKVNIVMNLPFSKINVLITSNNTYCKKN